MARKFLYLIAVAVVLLLAGAFALSLFSRQASQMAFVPRGKFVAQAPLATSAYADAAMWYARPGMADALVHYRPGGADTAPVPVKAAVFFVHPTSYIPLALTEQANWNAALDDPTAAYRAKLFLKGMASPFAAADEIWAPKYRQAVAGAFLTDKPEAQMAIDAAYADVRDAFRYFLSQTPKGTPIVLAGHSQGAQHILRLLREEVPPAGVSGRIAAVYAIGWPISVEHDLPALPLPACETAQQAGCIVTWSSFAEPADPAMLMTRYAATPGYDGKPRGSGAILCINPLTGTRSGSASAASNLGSLVPHDDLAGGDLVVGAVPARCDSRGLLLIGDPPRMGQGVLPGNNYHVYDIPLFWRNLEVDFGTRMAAWTAKHPA